jgi:hypothetical protein
MVQVHLPSTTFSAEPLLLALVADFGRPASDSAVWNAWDREGGVGAMRYLHEQGGHGQLPLSILSDKLAPAATRAEGIVLPVCGLHSADHVRDYVVEPILQIARRFECGVAVARAPGASALMP